MPHAPVMPPSRFRCRDNLPQAQYARSLALQASLLFNSRARRSATRSRLDCRARVKEEGAGAPGQDILHGACHFIARRPNDFASTKGKARMKKSIELRIAI